MFQNDSMILLTYQEWMRVSVQNFIQNNFFGENLMEEGFSEVNLVVKRGMCDFEWAREGNSIIGPQQMLLPQSKRWPIRAAIME